MVRNPPSNAGVEIRWRPDADPRRLRRVAEILANIVDATQRDATAAPAEEAKKR